MEGGWSQFRQLQDRFSALVQAKWSSPVGNNKTRNVADSKRDLLFVWNAAECSLLVVNVGLFANAGHGGKTNQVGFALFFAELALISAKCKRFFMQSGCLCRTRPKFTPILVSL